MPRKNPLPPADLKIGERVRIVRERLGLSRTAFARGLGIDSSTVANIELGRTPLRYETGRRLSSHFFVNPKWLATGEPPVKFDIRFYGQRYDLPPNAPFRKAYEEVLARPVEKALSAQAEKLHCRIEELDAVLGARPNVLSPNSPEAIAEKNRRIVQWAENVLSFLPPDLHEPFLKEITTASDNFFRSHARAIAKHRAGSNEK